MRTIAYSANELADILANEYAFPVDTQLVRRKCNEYVKEGLFATEKQGKSLLYKQGLSWDELHEPTALSHAVSLMQLDTPFGYVGNTIMSRLSKHNHIFRIKHGFPAFTLEDEIAYKLLAAKESHSYIEMNVVSNRRAGVSDKLYGVPLKIFVSTRTGRRYICIYRMTHEKAQTGNKTPGKLKFHFRCVRLDQIKSVNEVTARDVNIRQWEGIEAAMSAFTEQAEKLKRNLTYVWGVSFQGQRTKVVLTLNINEQWEKFILERLDREGKGGRVTRKCDNTFCYEKIVFDANEMFPWLRTFIGRIEDIRFYSVDHEGGQGAENLTLRKHFMSDIDSMCQMYEI